MVFNEILTAAYSLMTDVFGESLLHLFDALPLCDHWRRIDITLFMEIINSEGLRMMKNIPGNDTN